MKKLLLITFFTSCIISYSQNSRVFKEIANLKKQNISFEMFNPLEKKAVVNYNNDLIVRKATYASLNLNEINRIFNGRFPTIEISIPYQNHLLKIELYRVNLFTDNFKINTDKSTTISYTKGVHYRGIIKGNESSLASFNFFEGEMNGIVSSIELGNLNIGKLMTPSNWEDYIIYSDIDLLVRNDFRCSTKDDSISDNSVLVNNRSATTNRCVTSYFEVGYQAYTANGSNLTTTTNWITSVFNNSQTLFNNDGISIVLKTVFIWTSDDYYSISSNLILPAFTNIRPSFDGDVGFIADIDPQQLISQSYSIGGLCTDRKFAYGDLVLNFSTVPNFSYSVYIIAHELGHTLGSHHTHACVWNGNNTAIDGCAQAYGGCTTPTPPADGIATIMSYCFPNFALGYGEQPANAIIQHINNSTCLGSDCLNSCINTIDFIAITDVTQNSATINWDDSNMANGQWDISIVPSGNSAVWTTIYTNSYFVNNLVSNTYYEVTIKKNCSDNLIYPKHSLLFATQGDNCGGTIIYDTGGQFSGYQGSEHIIRTIVPTEPNKKIRLVFNTLSLVPFEAFLFVYDGLNNNGPLLNVLTNGYPFLAYGFSNYFEPWGSVFESQDPSGALTIEFFSSPTYYFNPIASTRGWKATISCLNVLDSDYFGDGFFDYSYSPNPVNNVLNITSKDMITEIQVFAIDGKLILTKKTFETSASIDLSSLVKGTYVTKLIFEKGEASFKILKE